MISSGPTMIRYTSLTVAFLLFASPSFAAGKIVRGPIDAVAAAYQGEISAMCRQVTGKPAVLKPGFVQSEDLNGDGKPDAILNSDLVECAGAVSLFSGSAGSSMQIALSRVDGSYRVYETNYYQVEKLGAGVLRLRYHGSVCGRAGAASCSALVHAEGEELRTFWWPDGNDAPGKQNPPLMVEEIGDFPWDHNGSVVRISTDVIKSDGSVIFYDKPKPALVDTVKQRQVLFVGNLNSSRPMLGTAFAFKKGCPPAPYPVKGEYRDGNNTLILTGPGPVRAKDGCDVVSYSATSPHSRLVFKALITD